MNLFRDVFPLNRQWNVGIINKPINSFVDEKQYEVEWLPTPESRLGTHTLSSLGDITLIDGAKSIERGKTYYKNKIQQIIEYLSK